MLLTSTTKKKTLSAEYSRVLAFLRVELRAFLSSGLLSRVRKVRSFKVEILIWAYTRENFLIHEANISKTGPVTLLFNAKTYSTARAECMCGIVKKAAEWNFSNMEISVFLNLSKIYSAEFFLIFPVSSFVCNKKIFIKKIWGHRLSF